MIAEAERQERDFTAPFEPLGKEGTEDTQKIGTKGKAAIERIEQMRLTHGTDMRVW